LVQFQEAVYSATCAAASDPKSQRGTSRLCHNKGHYEFSLGREDVNVTGKEACEGKLEGHEKQIQVTPQCAIG